MIKQDILSCIDRKIEDRVYKRENFGASDEERAKEEILQELRQEIEAMEEWIPVGEDFPYSGQSVLVYLKPMEEGVEGDIKDARFFADGLGTRFRIGVGDFVHGMYLKHKDYIQRDSDDTLYKLTHWQPLPLPPNTYSHDNN